MCGIVATHTLDGSPADAALLVRMRDVLTHRGPDDAGLRVDGPVGLGHRRLTIVDLTTAGHQPMPNEDESIWLVFNGEIYNYVELAADLRQRGHRFRSHTDSEVIIHLYEELGERCVERLNGMFAFVLWDARTRTLFGARDRAGIKPLYYRHAPGRRFSCASEIKAILEDPEVPRVPDPAGLAGWLLSGTPTAGRTLFQGVQELAPGHAFRLAHGRLTTWKYWDVVYAYDHGRDLADVVEQLADLLDDAVRLHCRSDAPLGCHLSGGIDSSTVTALTTRHRMPVPTFSIRFGAGGRFDESRYSEALARHVGVENRVATPTHEDFATLLASLIWHMDAPLMDHSAFSYYSVSRLASEQVKVSMTGHGGDEVFAGYPAQFMAAFGSTAMFADHGSDGGGPGLSARVRAAFQRHGMLGLLRRAMHRSRPAAGSDTLEQFWIRSHCSARPADDPLLHPDLVHAVGAYDPVEEFLAPLRHAPTAEVLDRCLYHDLRHYLPMLLHAEDRVSMAVSLESRVPLLDYRLIEFMATVPPAQKVAGMVPKALLRRAARRWVPSAILDRRDKGHFAVPSRQWLETELAGFAGDVIGSRTAQARGVFAPRAVRSGLLARLVPWNALNLEIWFRLFVDRDPEWLDRIGAAQAPARQSV